MRNFVFFVRHQTTYSVQTFHADLKFFQNYEKSWEFQNRGMREFSDPILIHLSRIVGTGSQQCISIGWRKSRRALFRNGLKDSKKFEISKK